MRYSELKEAKGRDIDEVIRRLDLYASQLDNVNERRNAQLLKRALLKSKASEPLTASEQLKVKRALDAYKRLDPGSPHLIDITV